MLRQRHSAEYTFSVATVFAVLLRVLGRSRWATEECWVPAGDPPRPGFSYVRRRDRVIRRGRVVECLPPVALTLYESIVDPPCHVRMRLRWRLEPSDTGCLVLLDAGYQLNGPAYLNRRHWRAQISRHCANLLSAVGAGLESQRDQGTVVSGQNTGSNSMTVTKTTTVNGSPSFK